MIILSDTKIIDQDQGKSCILGGALKTVILDPSLCISYAGNALVGIKALRDLPKGTLKEKTDYLLKIHNENSAATDFLICSLEPPQIIEIKKGKASEVSASWIGDIDAFELYQKYFHESEQTEDPKFYEMYSPEIREGMILKKRMESAIQKVIDDANIKSVGDFLVRVEPLSDGFRYWEQAYAANLKPVIGNTKALQSLTTATDTTTGGYNYSLLVPKKAGIGAIGIYFLQGSLGALFYPIHKPILTTPLAIDPAIKYPNKTMKEFIEAVYKDHGFMLTGIGLAQEGFEISFS